MRAVAGPEEGFLVWMRGSVTAGRGSKCLRRACLGRMSLCLSWLKLVPRSESWLPPWELGPINSVTCLPLGHPNWLWGQLGPLGNVFKLSGLQFPHLSHEGNSVNIK